MANNLPASPTEILEETGAESPVTTPTFLQKTGLLLAASVGLLGAFVILALVFGWMHSAPATPRRSGREHSQADSRELQVCAADST